MIIDVNYKKTKPEQFQRVRKLKVYPTGCKFIGLDGKRSNPNSAPEVTVWFEDGCQHTMLLKTIDTITITND